MDIDYSKFPRTSMGDFMNGVPPRFPYSPIEVKTSAQLDAAIEQQVDTIIIEGGLASDATRIQATGKLSWAVAIGTLCVNALKIILDIKSGSQPSFTASEKGKYFVQNASAGRIVLKRI